MNPSEEDDKVLLVANSYTEKYYFNRRFAALSQNVQDELQAMAVLFTEEVGGILVLSFQDDGTLLMESTAIEEDYLFDEIEAGMRKRKIETEKAKLFSALELYYRTYFLNHAETDSTKESDN